MIKIKKQLTKNELKTYKELNYDKILYIST